MEPVFGTAVGLGFLYEKRSRNDIRSKSRRGSPNQIKAHIIIKAKKGNGKVS